MCHGAAGNWVFARRRSIQLDGLLGRQAIWPGRLGRGFLRADNLGWRGWCLGAGAGRQRKARQQQANGRSSILLRGRQSLSRPGQLGQ